MIAQEGSSGSKDIGGDIEAAVRSRSSNTRDIR